MSRFVLLLLIICVLYFALKYLKGPRNKYADSDGFTTHPFGGEVEDDDGSPLELDDADEDTADEDTEEELEYDKTDENNEANTASLVDTASAPGAAAVTHTSTNTEVVIDSEVRIDAQMTSDAKAKDVSKNS